MEDDVFRFAATGFKVYYFDGKTGFTSPTWLGYQTVNMGLEIPSKTWLLANGFAENTDLNTDQNGDGVSLLMAYALGLDPNENLAGSLPQPTFAGDQMSISFHGSAEGIAYAVETSTDMQTWTAEGVTLSAPDGNGIRTATVGTDAPRRFLRLTVSH